MHNKNVIIPEHVRFTCFVKCKDNNINKLNYMYTYIQTVCLEGSLHCSDKNLFSILLYNLCTELYNKKANNEILERTELK